MTQEPIPFGREFKNEAGEVVGCYTVLTTPVFVGLNNRFEPMYKFEMVSRPMLYAYPEVIMDFCEN